VKSSCAAVEDVAVADPLDEVVKAVEDSVAVWLGLIRNVSDAVGVPVLEGVLLADGDCKCVTVARGGATEAR